MVGAGRLELPISCSQSRRASHYATPRGVAGSLEVRGFGGDARAGVAQRQSPSLPSWWCGFDSRRPLWWEAQVSGLPATVGGLELPARATSVPQRATTNAPGLWGGGRSARAGGYGFGHGSGTPRGEGAAM